MKKIFLLIISLLPSVIYAQGDTTHLGIEITKPRLSSLTATHQVVNLIQSDWSYIFLFVFVFISIILIIVDFKYPNSISNIFSMFTNTIINPNIGTNDISGIQKFITSVIFWMSIVLIPSYLIISLDKILKTWPFAYLVSSVALGFLIVFLLLLNYAHFLITKVIYNAADFGKSLIIEFKSFISAVGLLSLLGSFLVYFSENLFFIRSIIYLSIAIFIFFYISKIILQIRTFKLYKFSILHFILYLCSVEILPVLLVLSIFKH